MFLVNHYIMYGVVGICRIRGIGNLDGEGLDPAKLYYTLEPLQSNGSTIYTPVENNKVRMRSIISREEAVKLIQEVPQLKPIRILDDKRCEQIYKEALKENDCCELLQIFKYLFNKEYKRSGNNQKLSAMDKKYMDLIKSRLFGELAIVLGIPCEKAESEIVERIEATKVKGK
ncbi:CarD family transcriptional regulator [Anaerocolumna jejuensis]|uniref:CarD family transcriptional regulator n=1 Tax=Anaerocolumna jejuensis TaxID=259063 RepID=UPI003F7C0DD7